MDIQRQAFENLWLAGGGGFDNLIFSKDQGKYIAIENSDLTDKQEEMSLYIVNNAYLFFVGGFKQAAKAQAIPDGFVLVPRECPDPIFADKLFDHLCEKAHGEFGDDQMIFFSDIDESAIWQLMIDEASQ